jgi:rubrerythrin
MDSIKTFTTALEFEKNIRDLYLKAVSIIDDKRGQAIFQTLADEEQSHIDFLEYSITTLQQNGKISHEQLKTSIPDNEAIRKNIESMQSRIPEQMLGDIKKVLSSALKLETETTEYYRKAFESAEGEIRTVLGKFVEIEQRHTDVVQFELDHASQSGFWFDLSEKNMEEGW